MNRPAIVFSVAAATVCLLSACSSDAPPPDPPRPVRTADVRYGAARESARYFASVQSRYEVEQSFRVAGKVVQRKVDVGQRVNAGDVLAVLDDADYRLAEEAARQQYDAATTRARQAEADWKRYQALKDDGSVSIADDEHAESARATARAAAVAEGRHLELARNQVRYTVLKASIGGVVTAVRVEAGQVVAAGQPAITVADPGEPEIVVDVPEDRLDGFKHARYRASLASAPDTSFEVTLRELSAQAAAQTRTYRARLKPASVRALPLGATATLIAERRDDARPVASVPASALTQSHGQPAVWTVRRSGTDPFGTVDLLRVTVHDYTNGAVTVSGPPEGTLVVTAGIQKMAPGLRVALPPVREANAR